MKVFLSFFIFFSFYLYADVSIGLELKWEYQLLVFICIVLSVFVYRHLTLRRYNKDLNIQQELFDAVFENSSDGVLIIDTKSGDLLDCNKSLVDIFGYESKQELLSMNFDELSPEYQDDKQSSRKKAISLKQKALHKKTITFEWIHIKADGKFFWCEIVLTSICIDDKQLFYANLKDIDDKKNSELQLIQHVQILDQVHDAIVSTDLEGNILTWNVAATKLLGYTQSEMIGENVKKLYFKDDYNFINRMLKILQTKSIDHVNSKILRKNSDLIYIDLSLSTLSDINGAVIGLIGYAQDITQRIIAKQQLLDQKSRLDYEAHHDPLTKLPNRLLFNDRLEQAIKKASRNKTIIALFFIDLDHFKEINDSLGHDIGDKVLQTVSTRLREHLRASDTLSRLGGDEFTIIMEDLKDNKDAMTLAENILLTLKKPIIINQHELYVSSSIGISLYPNDNTKVTSLLKYADAAMYKAKEEGRDNYQFYSAEMTQKAFKRVVMEASIRQAIKNNEFIVYFQPQVDALKHKISGFEALIRWSHPRMGLIYPSKFIQTAEDTGLIIDLDRWMMFNAVEQVCKWKKENMFDGTLSINLSVKYLESKTLLDDIKECLKKYPEINNYLELEVTESGVMKNPQDSIEKLKEINSLGVSIAIDDFGTGYSSLSYLKLLPISKLKIDQSFVRDIGDDENDRAIIIAIIALAKSLKLSLLAEGVETQNQKEFLLDNGCDVIQGYLYSRPIPYYEALKYIQDF